MREVSAYKQKKSKDTPLNALRLERNLSITEIAKRLGKSIGTISILFNHTQVPQETTLRKLAEIFNMSYVDLCKTLGVDPENPYNDDFKGSHRKHTFWNKVKEESGLSLAEVAEGIGMKGKYRMVGKYFTGELMPNDAKITAICNLFDVDFAQGKTEFKKASDTYKAKKKGTSTTKPATEVKGIEPKIANKPEPKVVPETTPIEVVKPEPAKKVDTPDIGRLLYKQVTYDEFEAIMSQVRHQTLNVSVLETIYGKVDCDTYNKVYAIINNK